MDDKAQARSDFRKILLEQLTQNEVDGRAIRQLIAASAPQLPELFEDYQVTAILDAIEPDTLDWSAGYFDRQRKFAQSNFSEIRIRHLIDVREFLIQNGIAGFAKAPPAVSSYGNQTMHTQANTTSYVPGENLAKMVQQGNPSLVRSALINELENNRLEETEISRALEWAAAKIADVFVPYEEHSLAGKMNQVPASWDADYYDLQTSYINSNFSRQRFEHLITVRNTLRQRGVKGFERIVIKKPQSQPSQMAASLASARPVDTASQPGFLRFALMAGGALAVLAALVISLL